MSTERLLVAEVTDENLRKVRLYAHPFPERGITDVPCPDCGHDWLTCGHHPIPAVAVDAEGGWWALLVPPTRLVPPEYQCQSFIAGPYVSVDAAADAAIEEMTRVLVYAGQRALHGRLYAWD